MKNWRGGRLSYTRTANGTPEQEEAAWAELANRFGPRRAAWILRVVESGQPISQRATSWTRAPRTDLMPDRWVVIGFEDGAERFRVVGNPIPSRLKTGWNPQVDDEPTDDLVTDDGMRWLVDFHEAEQVGMTVRIDLANYTRDLVDELLTIGVKASAEDATDIVEKHIDALHYTAGLGFVRQDTPTNNTETASAGYSAHDPGHRSSFNLERNSTPVPEGSSGALLADALGADRSLFNALALAHGHEEAGAGAMNTALWPATWGYFMDRIIRLKNLAGGNYEQDWQTVYDLFRDNVRARGPLSAVRVGKQPYGVLPLVSLENWKPTVGEESDDRLRSIMQIVRDHHWKVYKADLYQLGESEDSSEDLVNILAQSALPMRFGLRQVFGEQVLRGLADLNRYNEVSGFLDQLWENLSIAFERLGLSRETPLAQSVFGSFYLLDVPLIDSLPLSGSDPLSANYISALRSTALADLKESPGVNLEHVLLCYMLCQAKLLAYARAIVTEAKQLEVVNFDYEHDRELLGVKDNDAELTIWEVFNQIHPNERNVSRVLRHQS